MTEQITLSDLNHQVKINLKESFPSPFWVVAEINSLQINTIGHCYMELIEKDAKDDQIIAKARATIWAFTFRVLRPYFETTAGQSLSPGMKVLINVQVDFHELYGYSLNIKDIDPNYTLGDLARQRMETIRRLKEEGIFEMNRDTIFPLLPQKIAIISSQTAAGYQDFLEELKNNPYGLKFYTRLFPAMMQGNETVNTIIASLDQIFKFESFFDLVVIIRGGGSQADLSIFDNYTLASNISQFPLPILTGIGHDKDESVVDMVAFQNLKTPTAVAGFLIESVLEIEAQTKSIYEQIVHRAKEITDAGFHNLNIIAQVLAPTTQRTLNNQKHSLIQITGDLNRNCSLFFQKKSSDLIQYNFKIEFNAQKYFTKIKYRLKNVFHEINYSIQGIFDHQKHTLSLLQRGMDLMNPERVLQRGYSITLANGRVVKDLINLKKSQIIKTILSKGIIESKVEKIKSKR